MGDDNYKINFYSGADYGLNPDYGKDFLNFGYRIPASEFGYPTDPTTANQLQAVSNKLNTGAKTIEVSGFTLQDMRGGMERIPEQHLEEINRLRKLTGVELTFHGPLVDPTGFQGRQGWQEIDREQAERQMWLALRRAQKINPNGNLVVTFHSSAGLPEPETKIFNEKTKNEEIKDFFFVDEFSGQFGRRTIEPDYFKSKEKEFLSPQEQIKIIKEILKEENDKQWSNELQQISWRVANGEEIIEKYLYGENEIEELKKVGLDRDKILKFYKNYVQGKDTQKIIEASPPEAKQTAKKVVNNLVRGEIFLRDAYTGLQESFNKAYATLLESKNEEQLKKLDSYREEIKNKIKYFEDPEKIPELAETINRGIMLLNQIKAPEKLKPLRKFAIEKASETFSNLALKSYNEFKDNAPIISIENPPSGGALSRGDDLRELINETRKKLTNKLVQEKNLPEKEAEKIAEKLIGVTWDVGHINMIRKFGYSEKEVIKQTEKIAPFVKHVHLSDNFGIEHTELPMGMGNVPVKPMLEAIEKYNKQVKKIVETGDWFSRQGGLAAGYTPVRETLRAFGSPIYTVEMAPYWNQTAHASGGYFVGYGTTLPEQHFSLYGAGFSNMPTELGGQMAGRSRASGAPID